jgi:hypothetical protein
MKHALERDPRLFYAETVTNAGTMPSLVTPAVQAPSLQRTEMRARPL